MAAGLPPDVFWQVTPGEAMVVQRGALDRIKRDADLQRQLVYAQAVLNSYAWHKPSKMPDYDGFFGGGRVPRARAQSPEQMMAIMQDWTARTQAAGLKEVH